MALVSASAQTSLTGGEKQPVVLQQEKVISFGQPQTPWGTDIDGESFNLFNAGVLSGSNYIDVKEYANGVLNRAAIVAAYTANPNRELVISAGTWDIGTPLTLPVGTVLRILPGAIITPSGTGSLNATAVGCDIVAGRYQIFASNLTVTMTGQVMPEWWGSTGLTDDTLAIQAAFNASYNVLFTSGCSYVVSTTPIQVRASTTITAYNATIYGTTILSAAYMFESIGVDTDHPISRVHWYGGTIDLNGAYGWFSIALASDCVFQEYRLKGKGGTVGLWIKNCYNIYNQYFNIHGTQGSAASGTLGAGIRVETTTDSSYGGWRVANNIGIKDAMIQRCEKCLDLSFAYASSGVDIQNIAFIDGSVPVTPTATAIYFTGILDHLSVYNSKIEDIPFGIYVSNNDTDRYKISVRDLRCTYPALQSTPPDTPDWSVFYLDGDNGTLLIETIDVNVGASTTVKKFARNDTETTVVDSISSAGSGTLSDWDGTGHGVVQRLQRHMLTKTTTTVTIAPDKDNYSWNNIGSTVDTTYTLPDATSKSSMRQQFIVGADTHAIIIDPKGTDQIIGITTAAGHKISCAKLGSSVTLCSLDTGIWFVESVYNADPLNPWLDIGA